jgi:triacylglycerol lipase
MNTKKIIVIPLVTIFLVMSFSVNAGWFDWWRDRDYTKTQYPIVLAHGLMGFESILSLIDYWPGIVNSLEKDGATVFITEVSTVNSSQVRGEQLLEQIEEIIAITGAEKVNLMGHSQGSLDARYVATVRPELIASITSIGGPHGSDITQLDIESGLLSGLIEALGNLIAVLSHNDNPVNIENLVQLFSKEGIEAFNNDYPIGLPNTPCGEGAAVEYVDGYPIRVYSWGGTAYITSGLDPTDFVFAITGSFFDESNDGLVTRCDNHLGDVIRDNYFMNHLDLTNMMFGLVSIFEANPKTVFRSHANRLRNAGL